MVRYSGRWQDEGGRLVTVRVEPVE